MIITQANEFSLIRFRLKENRETTEQQEEEEKKSVKRPESNIAKKEISGKVRSRMSRAVTSLCNAYTIGIYGKKYIYYRKQINLTFVTLTLPSQQKHTDYQIKQKCLNEFIQYARK
ncbi:MAG: hypothetical protein HC892_22765, partial [Saprospiraceae bacterium]|nr:hypothetical protein [Saprospiraceae bacterium]